METNEAKKAEAQAAAQALADQYGAEVTINAFDGDGNIIATITAEPAEDLSPDFLAGVDEAVADFEAGYEGKALAQIKGEMTVETEAGS